MTKEEKINYVIDYMIEDVSKVLNEYPEVSKHYEIENGKEVVDFMVEEFKRVQDDAFLRSLKIFKSLLNDNEILENAFNEFYVKRDEDIRSDL